MIIIRLSHFFITLASSCNKTLNYHLIKITNYNKFQFVDNNFIIKQLIFLKTKIILKINTNLNKELFLKKFFI